MQRTFTLEINIAETFSIDEIWPDGDAPENPTVGDVREVFFRALHGSIHQRCADWGLEIRKEDVQITMHDSKDVQQLKELARQLRARELRIADLPISCESVVPDPPGPGKCPTPGCENLEDGNCPTGQCMDCVQRVYEAHERDPSV